MSFLTLNNETHKVDFAFLERNPEDKPQLIITAGEVTQRVLNWCWEKHCIIDGVSVAKQSDLINLFQRVQRHAKANTYTLSVTTNPVCRVEIVFS